MSNNRVVHHVPHDRITQYFDEGTVRDLWNLILGSAGVDSSMFWSDGGDVDETNDIVYIIGHIVSRPDAFHPVQREPV